MLRPQAVNVAVVRNNNKGLPGGWKVLLIQRAASQTYPLAWGLMSGSRIWQESLRESLTETAIREMQEELGLSPQSLWSTDHLVTFYELASDSIWHAPVFVAVTDEEKFSISNEIAQYAWFDEHSATERVHWKSLKQFVPELFDELSRFPDATWKQL